MENFKSFDGEEIKDVRNYIKNFLIINPDTELIVGTDSEQYKNYTNYVTVICMVKKQKGVHVIYKRHKSIKIKDLYKRLWNEIEFSKITADYIKDIKNTEIHIDINKNKIRKSNIVYDSAIGYLTSFGYSVESKPNSWAASKAADLLC